MGCASTSAGIIDNSIGGDSDYPPELSFQEKQLISDPQDGLAVNLD